MSQAQAPDRRIAYQPALDGLRAFAVVAVLLYHQGFVGADAIGHGGFIGVDIFFVLSGFLITSLLLAEHVATGTIALGTFWVRRLRRLAPALILMVAFATLLARTVYSDRFASLVKLDAPWVLTYLLNWRIAFGHTSIVSPISHTWSLAVEEQWYLLWPLVLIVLLRLVRDRRAWTIAAIGGLAIASSLWGWYLLDRDGLSRVFFGTDVRAQELLVGAALAAVGTGGAVVIRRGAAWVQAAGLVVLAGLVGIVLFAHDGPRWFPFGRLGLAVAVAVVIVAAVQPRGVLRSILAVTPLIWLGRISYGVYLFHFPVYSWLGPTTTGLDGLSLFAVRLLVTLAIAIASYALVEMPIRRGRVANRVLVPVGIVTAAAVLFAASIGVADFIPQPRSPLLAKYLPEFAAKGPRGTPHVLALGGDRADGLSAASLHQPVLEHGDWVLAVGAKGCGLTSPDPLCRDFSTDLPTIAAAFRSGRVVLMVEEADLVGLERAPRSGIATLVRRFDRLGRGLGYERLSVVTLPCNTRLDPSVREVNAAVRAWAGRHSIPVRSLAGEPCSDGLRPVAPTRALWSKVLGAGTAGSS